MSRKAGNVSTTATAQSQTAQSASVSQEFGDVSQYRELNAIGTGETGQSNSFSISSVPQSLLAWARVYYFVTSCHRLN